MRDAFDGALAAELVAELESLRDAGCLADSMEAGFSVVDGVWQDATTRGRSDHVMRLSEEQADAGGHRAVAECVRLLKGVGGGKSAQCSSQC